MTARRVQFGDAIEMSLSVNEKECIQLMLPSFVEFSKSFCLPFFSLPVCIMPNLDSPFELRKQKIYRNEGYI